MNLQYKYKILSLFAWIFLNSYIFLSVSSLSQTCDVVSPIQYKVKEGTSNFSFQVQLEARFVGDSNIRNCSFGFLIEDLVCVDLVQTICCCNSFIRKSSAICQIPSKITEDRQYVYQGLAQIQGTTGAVCSGVISVIIDRSQQPSSNLGMIIGIVGGVIVLIIVGVIVYRKIIKNKGSQKIIQKDNPPAPQKKSLINSNSNGSIHKKVDSISSKHSIGGDLYDKIDEEEKIIKVPKPKNQPYKVLSQKQRMQYERYLFQKQREKRDYEAYLKQKQQNERKFRERQDKDNRYDSRKYEDQKDYRPYNQNPNQKKNQMKKQLIPDLEQKELTDSLIAKQYNHRDSYK